MDLKKTENLSVDYVLWEITKSCNLDCIHCRASAAPGIIDNDAIKGEKAKRILSSLAELKTKTLVFTGGEPLLRNDLEELINYAASLGIRCRVQSNGTLITEERMSRLKQAGVFSIGIGLDSPYNETHDYIRNQKGVYNKAVNAIKNIKQFGVSCHVEYTLTRYNINDLPEMLELINSLKVDTFFVRSAIFCGRSVPDKNTFQLSSDEYRDILTDLYKLSKRYPKIKIGSQDPLYHLVQTDILKSIERYGDINSGDIICGCTAGLNTMNLKSNGEVGICTFLPQISLGNIHEKSLEEIWRNRFSISPDLTNLVSRNFTGKCGGCNHRYICGGCRARALGVNLNILEADPYCWCK